MSTARKLPALRDQLLQAEEVLGELLKSDPDIPALHRELERANRAYMGALGDSDEEKLQELGVRIAALHLYLNAYPIF